MAGSPVCLGLELGHLGLDSVAPHPSASSCTVLASHPKLMVFWFPQPERKHRMVASCRVCYKACPSETQCMQNGCTHLFIDGTQNEVTFLRFPSLETETPEQTADSFNLRPEF